MEINYLTHVGQSWSQQDSNCMTGRNSHHEQFFDRRMVQNIRFQKFVLDSRTSQDTIMPPRDDEADCSTLAERLKVTSPRTDSKRKVLLVDKPTQLNVDGSVPISLEVETISAVAGSESDNDGVVVEVTKCDHRCSSYSTNMGVNGEAAVWLHVSAEGGWRNEDIGRRLHIVV